VTYHFPSTYRNPAKIKPATHVYDTKLPTDAEQITPIQGITPASLPEWRVAMALYKTGYEFIFQQSVYNGPTPVTIIDYLVLNAGPLPVPLFEDGEEWHITRNATSDEYKRGQLNKIMYGRYAKFKVIWEFDAPSIPVAMTNVRKVLNG